MARVASVLALVSGVMVGLGACSTPEPEGSTVTLVMGAGKACAGAVRGVHLAVKDGARAALERDFVVEGKADLPVSADLAIPASTEAPWVATATFDLDQGPLTAALHPSVSAALPAGTSGRVPLVLACVCLSVVCAEGETCAELPVGSGQVTCVSPALCGNASCEAGEDHTRCPADCPAACGDGICDGGEDCASCALDCGACCGDGACGHGETCNTCAKDCGPCPTCGDGTCQPSESCKTCPADCACTCGDGQCTGDESCATCVGDCGYCPPACSFVVSPPSGGQGTLFSMALTSSNASSCSVTLDGAPFATFTPCAWSPAPLLGSDLPTGAHAVSVVAVGPAGVEGTCTGTFTVLPRASCSLSLSPDPVCLGASFSADLTLSGADTCTLLVDGGAPAPLTCAPLVHEPFAATTLGLGAHAVTVGVDGPGGEGSCADTITVFDTTCQVDIVDHGGCNADVTFTTNGTSCTTAVNDPAQVQPISCAFKEAYAGLAPGTYTVYLNVVGGPCGPKSCSRTVTLSC